MIMPDFILIDETIIKFGYDPTIFKGKKDYRKTIVRTCFKCGNIYDQKFIYAVRSFQNKQKCRYCSNKENSNIKIEERSRKLKEKYTSGEIVHPMLNKTHSEDAKEKIRNFYLGKSYDDRFGLEKSEFIKNKMRDSHLGDKNHFFGKKHSNETIEKLKELGTKNAKSGKESHLYGKMYHPKPIKAIIDNKSYCFKSIWEYKVANYLHISDIKWEYETKKFELLIGDMETTYTPDFYLIETNTIIEVKGYWRDDAKIKFEQFLNAQGNNFNIEVWDKIKLKSLNLI